MKKQDKRLKNHHFPLHLPQQTKHHSGYPQYAASKWCSINFQWVFGMQLIAGGGGGRINKALGSAESTWVGIQKETFTKIEAYAGIVERLVRYLLIEEALQDEIKVKLEHNNHSCVNWCTLSDKEIIITRLYLPLHMIWVGRRDHLVGDMTPLADMPSSLVEEARGSLKCSSITKPSGSDATEKRG